MPGYANKEFAFEFISHGVQRQRVTDGKTMIQPHLLI